MEKRGERSFKQGNRAPIRDKKPGLRDKALELSGWGLGPQSLKDSRSGGCFFEVAPPVSPR